MPDYKRTRRCDAISFFRGGGMRGGGLTNKMRLMRIGLYGFIAGLILCFMTLSWNGAAAVAADIGGYVDILYWIDGITAVIFPLGFLMIMICFILIIGAAVMKPREMDPAPLLKQHLAGVILIFAVGVFLSVTPLLGSIAAVMIMRFIHGGGIITLSLAYFMLAIFLFIVAVLWALLHGVFIKIGPVYGPPWIARMCGFVREDRLSSPAGGRAVRSLTKAEKALTFLLGIAVYVVFTLGRSLSVGRDAGAGPQSFPKGAVSIDILISAVALFVVMFSTLIIVKAVRLLIRRDSGEPKGESS